MLQKRHVIILLDKVNMFGKFMCRLMKNINEYNFTSKIEILKFLAVKFKYPKTLEV